MEAYRVTLEDRPNYVSARGEGPRTPENATRFLREVREACQRLGRTAALIDFRLEGPSLGTGAIYGIITERAAAGASLARIAYVEGSPGKDAGAKFAVDVAVNRGLNVR